MKITDYFVASNSGLSKLEDDVVFWMKQGWQPFGGLCTNRLGDMSWYHQAMVKYG